jgi:hypothetical protein
VLFFVNVLGSKRVPGQCSERFLKPSTLNLTSPFGTTLGLALAFFLVLLVAVEGLLRTQLFEAHFLATQRGSRHRQFEIQLGLLETIVAREGPIECIFLGNSMVMHGFEPIIFAQAYRAQTGRSIRCFNFGIDGLPTVVAGALSKVLVEDFQPRLLIYGTDARDYNVTMNAEDASVLMDTPWLKYRLGEFSVQGWLQEHSYLYRYQETISIAIRLQTRYYGVLNKLSGSKSEIYGFWGDDTIGTFVTSPPDPHNEGLPKNKIGHVESYFKHLSNYDMLPEHLAGLEQIVQQEGSGLQVLIVAMPVPDTYYYFFGNGRGGYQRFIEQVSNVAQANKVQFLQTSPLHLIPDDGWSDYSHLNTTGAGIFSAWLGQRVGEMVNQGKIYSLVGKAQ